MNYQPDNSGREEAGKSPPPRIQQAAPSKRDPRLVFAVQKRHNAHDYFALRLEVRGALKSWIVPKGLSMDPEEKRLAIETEVQPRVSDEIIWDQGWYEPVGPGAGPNDRMWRGLKRGAIRFVLYGKKLKGGFSLVRFREPDQWLLTKRDDMYAKGTATEPEESVRKSSRSP